MEAWQVLTGMWIATYTTAWLLLLAYYLYNKRRESAEGKGGG